MQEIVVIDGEIELENTLDGEVELETITDLDPEVVLSAGGGITPTGTINITDNGVYDVTEYASADVDVQGGITPTGTKQISITANGVTTEDVTNYASAQITANVPNSYSASDEEKVVVNGALVSQTQETFSANGTYATTTVGEAVIAVPASAVDSGTKNINTNGTHDVVGYANASVNVPNSYSAGDEGKVVSNGALVAQTSDTVTANDTYDTTLINSLTVNVSGSSGWTTDGIAGGTEPSGQITITANNIVSYGLAYKSELTGITADSVTTLRQGICSDCSKLVSVSFANATSVNGTQQFVNCTKLTNVNLPNLTAVNNQMFQWCSSLEVIDFPKVTALNKSGVFRNCYKLSTVVLRHTSVVAINSDTFANTPLVGYNSLSGTVYVPNSLISSYQSATNWSTLYNNGTCTFVKIEGSIYE